MMMTAAAQLTRIEQIVESVVVNTALPPGIAIDAPDSLWAYRTASIQFLQLHGLPVPSDAWLDEFILEMVAWHRDDDAGAAP
jgi:hypothetical protein